MITENNVYYLLFGIYTGRVDSEETVITPVSTHTE